MKKYMGNKSKILPSIYKAAQIAPEARTIFDAFSGTTNVGRYFRSKGYRVLSNDVNSTSFLLGNVYLLQNEIPKFENLFNSCCYTIQQIKNMHGTDEFESKKVEFIKLNHNTNNEDYLSSISNTNAFDLLVYLSFFASNQDYEDTFYNYDLLASDFIWRNYCYNGYKSEYFNLVSQKSINSQIELLENIGTTKYSSDINIVIEQLRMVYTPPFSLDNISTSLKTLVKINEDLNNIKITKCIAKLETLLKRKNHTGRRMFFSEEHGHRIDTINNLNLLWYKDGLITQEEYNFIQCSLVEAVALFSNTSATYQAFYKTYRANTQQTFRLFFPEIVKSNQDNKVFCEDTFKLINNIKEEYDILYLDPPYNWRIYDSNYHLLNLLSDYLSIADSIIDFEKGIAGAAGENRTTQRSYTNYNRRNTFEELLFDLIKSSNCKYVVISYSDSLSNHNKNSHSSVEKISQFLKDPDYFVPSTYKKIEVNSINFESRKSEKKEEIHELLFIAEKK